MTLRDNPPPVLTFCFIYCVFGCCVCFNTCLFGCWFVCLFVCVFLCSHCHGSSGIPVGHFWVPSGGSASTFGALGAPGGLLFETFGYLWSPVGFLFEVFGHLDRAFKCPKSFQNGFLFLSFFGPWAPWSTLGDIPKKDAFPGKSLFPFDSTFACFFLKACVHGECSFACCVFLNF